MKIFLVLLLGGVCWDASNLCFQAWIQKLRFVKPKTPAYYHVPQKLADGKDKYSTDLERKYSNLEEKLS